jgi:Fic family protein
MFDTNWEMINGVEAHAIEVLNAANQTNALEGLLTLLLAHKGPFGVGNAPMPDEGALLELHRAGTLFLLAQPGAYRNIGVEVAGPDGVVHTPPPWQSVPAFMQHFFRELSCVWSSRDALDVASFVLWKINWIHPFRNGNGRTARVFSYACLCLKLGVKLPGQPTVIDQIMAERSPYEHALKTADNAFAQNGTPDLSEMRSYLNRLLHNQVASVAP